MSLIATQPVEGEILDTTEYQIWEDKDLEQPDGSTISIKNLIGSFSISRLERENENIDRDIESSQERKKANDSKIAAINSLKDVK